MGSRLTKPVSAADMPTGIDAAKIANGAVSNAEYQRLDGVTAPIQDQINLALQSVVEATYNAGTSTSSAIVATTPSPLVAGQLVALTATQNSFAAVTAAFNGGSALSIFGADGSTNARIRSGRKQFYYYTGSSLISLPSFPQDTTESLWGFTGTKDASTFARGDGTMSNTLSGGLTIGTSLRIGPSGAVLNNSDNVSSVYFAGGTSIAQSSCAYLQLFGNSHASTPGIAALYLGSAANSRFSIVNASAVEAFRFQDGEFRIPSSNTAVGSASERWIGSGGNGTTVFINCPTGGGGTLGVNNAYICGWSVSGFFATRISHSTGASDLFIRQGTSPGNDNRKVVMASAGADNDPTRGAINELVGLNATNEAGANIRRSTGRALAASTSYNLCAIAATDCGFLRIIDNTGATSGAVVTILNGAISGSLAGDTATYVTTSPTSTQMQLSISGGFLVGTTGSGWTKKVAIIADIARMV